MNNPYHILGISHNATKEETKTAYKKLAKIYHPDKNNGDDTKFKEIQTAYETLTKPIHTHTPRSTHPHPSTIFKNIFKHVFNETINKICINYTLVITLDELYHGCIKKINMKYYFICSMCNGSGEKLSSSHGTIRCNKCNGNGKELHEGLFVIKVIPGEHTYNTVFSYPWVKNSIVKVSLRIHKHPIFTFTLRNNIPTLTMIYKIPLKQALIANQIEYEHINKEKMLITFEDDFVIHDKYQRIEENLGMPLPNGLYSNLLIEFSIIYPKTLDKQCKSKLLDIDF
jgi:DnaJ-class molecular chaperone